MPNSSSVAADGLGQYPRRGNFPQPSEADWLAQTYGGASKDYEGEFENRVNQINKSHSMPTPGEKQENVPTRRHSMRKMVAKHVSTLFNKEGKVDRATKKHAGASKDNNEGARSRRPEIPPLTFDGVGDEPDLDNNCDTKSVVMNGTNTTVSPYSHMIDNNGPADHFDTAHNLHSVNLNLASPLLLPPPHRSLTSTMSSGTSPSTFSKVSFPQHSSVSTAPASSYPSTLSSMDDFRTTTRELLQAAPPTMSTGMQRPHGPLDPIKFDPVKMGMSHQVDDV